MEQEKDTRIRNTNSTPQETKRDRMPRYNYYFLDYQQIVPSVKCAFSVDDDKSRSLSPKFGTEYSRSSEDALYKCSYTNLQQCSSFLDASSSVYKSADVNTSHDKGSSSRGCTFDTEDELACASVVDGYSALDSVHDENIEGQDELQNSRICIDADTVSKMENWSTRYASGNMEAFREKQEEFMSHILKDLVYDGKKTGPTSLEEFSIRCIFKRGETISDNKFDPAYIRKGDVIVDRYHVGAVIGVTSFSVVLKAKDQLSGEDVCIKISMPDNVNQAIDEINILKILNYRDSNYAKGIVRLLDYFYHGGCVFLVLELLGHNLYKATQQFCQHRAEATIETISDSEVDTKKEQQCWNLKTLRKVAYDILRSLKYLHSLGIINCDLKPENIVLTGKSHNECEDPMVKLIDFGSSCFIKDRLNTYVQSRSYRAPEVLLGLPYDTQIDLWSLGCVLCEIYLERILFPSDNNASLMASMISLLGVPPVYLLQHKMNSTFMLLPNGNVADLNVPNSISKISPNILKADNPSSIRCNVSISGSSKCSFSTSTNCKSKLDLDSVANISTVPIYDALDSTQAAAQPSSTSCMMSNGTPQSNPLVRKSCGLDYSREMMAQHKIHLGSDNCGFRFDICHDRGSQVKFVRIIEPCQCSIDDMLGSNRSEEARLFADFIKGLLQYDPTDRYTASIALLHPFVNTL